MKTVKMNDELFESAERIAARRGVSVDDLVSGAVSDLVSRESPEESPAYRARMRLAELARNSHRGMIGEWNREEAYAERLSRYERSGLRGDRGKDASGEVEGGNGDPRSD
jgi:hypothetical protein